MVTQFVMTCHESPQADRPRSLKEVPDMAQNASYPMHYVVTDLLALKPASGGFDQGQCSGSIFILRRRLSTIAFDEFLDFTDRRNHQTIAHIYLSRSQHTMSGMTTPGQISCSDPSGVRQFK